MINDAAQRLRQGRPTIGSWLMIGHPAVAEIFARAGFDWLVIDLEHTAIDLAETEAMIRAIQAGGVSALVRLAANDPVLIKRVMDAGADGVVVPDVRSAEEARQAVESVYYPPRGRRGVGLGRASAYGAAFAEYRDWLDRGGPLIVAQIEHVEAIDSIAEIVEIEGIDALFIGPYDLSASLGRPGDFANPELGSAIEKVEGLARSAGMPLGVHIVEPDPAVLAQRLAEGYGFIAYSVDTRMLDASARRGLTAVAEQRR